MHSKNISVKVYCYIAKVIKALVYYVFLNSLSWLYINIITYSLSGMDSASNWGGGYGKLDHYLKAKTMIDMSKDTNNTVCYYQHNKLINVQV